MDKPQDSTNSTHPTEETSAASSQSAAPLSAAQQPKRKKIKKEHKIAGGVLIVTLALIAGFGGGYLGQSQNTGAGITQFQQVQNDGNLTITESEENIAAVVNKVSPSVVSIVTSTENRFTRSQAAGTGMIVASDGYIMTNKHVIDGSSDVSVVTSDGTTYDDVTVLGSDPLNDVAFIKINDVDDLPAVEIGDSKTLRVGQNVVAIGNALGQYQNTVTSGIVSGLGRPVIASSDGTAQGAESLTDLIQTDAAINSGNSGGPLLNMQGQVIGMNTAVAQNAQSIGFAIPIGATKGMLSNVLATDEVERAFLGVQFVTITPEVKQEYNLDVARGDYIFAQDGSPIQNGSPADEAGLRNRDIITKVNGAEVGPGQSTSTLIGEFEVGDTISLTILRGDKTIQKNVTLTSFDN